MHNFHRLDYPRKMLLFHRILHTIDLAYLQNSNYDLIVADFNLPENLDKKWIHIHGNHSLGDFKFIVDTIYDIMEMKQKTDEKFN